MPLPAFATPRSAQTVRHGQVLNLNSWNSSAKCSFVIEISGVDVWKIFSLELLVMARRPQLSLLLDGLFGDFAKLPKFFGHTILILLSDVCLLLLSKQSSNLWQVARNQLLVRSLLLQCFVVAGCSYPHSTPAKDVLDSLLASAKELVREREEER